MHIHCSAFSLPHVCFIEAFTLCSMLTHTFSAFSNPNPFSVQSANLLCIIYGCWGAPKMLVKAKRHSQLSYSHLFLSPSYLSYHHDFLPPRTYFRTSLLPSMFPSALRCCLYPSHLFHLSSIFFPSPASFKLPCSHCFKLPPVNTCLVSLCGFFFLLVDLTTHLRQSISICFSV